jgi:two-component system, chemotaxis family, response regulator Rcp1
MEILLVEDSLEDARAAIEVLEHGHARCRVSLVRDGEEALAFVRRQGIFAKAPRPDLILLDMQLPKKDGRQVLAEIQADEHLKCIPVIVLSVSSLYRALLESDCLRVLEFMSKPLPSEPLVRLVKSLHHTLLTEIVAASLT